MPKPLKFPIKFRVFLRLAIGGRLYAERLRIFRKFWCAMLKQMAEHEGRAGSGDNDTTDVGRKDMAAKAVDKYGRDGIDESDFCLFKADIAIWRSLNRIEQRKNAAQSRWKKQKAKKSLGAVKKQKM
jgi:hypothetical protein